ncbi:MAG: S1 family peptidase [Polyangiales bacterium]
MRRPLTLIALLAVTGCASTTQEPTAERASPIIGGAPSQLDGVVGLIRPDGAQCSGVVVSKRVILTAGHCLTGVDATAIEVRIGVDYANPDATASVMRAERYPTATGTSDDFEGGVDLGALLVVSDLPVTPVARSVVTSDDDLCGKQVLVVGYGRSAPFDPTSNQKRLAVTMPVERCCNRFLQMGGADANACSGDSGGAVLLDGALVALVSAGIDGCSTFTTFTRLTPHQAWIDRVVAGDFGRPCPECMAPDPACDAPVPTPPAPPVAPAPDDRCSVSASGAPPVPFRWIALALAALSLRSRRSRR